MDSRVIALFSWLNRFRFSKDFSEIFLSAITFTFYLSHPDEIYYDSNALHDKIVKEDKTLVNVHYADMRYNL